MKNKALDIIFCFYICILESYWTEGTGSRYIGQNRNNSSDCIINVRCHEEVLNLYKDVMEIAHMTLSVVTIYRHGYSIDTPPNLSLIMNGFNHRICHVFVM